MNFKSLFILCPVFMFFTVKSQNIHTAQVKGIVSIGNQEIALILDENTGETYKTAIYNENLLEKDDVINIEFFSSEEAKISNNKIRPLQGQKATNQLNNTI